MNLPVIRSPRATEDILAIVAYLAEHSPLAARQFLDGLAQAQERLSSFPNSSARGLVSGSRRLILGDYIVSYRVRRETVQIVAVRHAKRGDARP
jgi:plasmid stabilization system protein ParE